MAITTVASSNCQINLTAYIGAGDGTRVNLIQYISASSLTGTVVNIQTKQVAANTSNVSYDLSLMFPSPITPVIITIQDVTSPGVGFQITTVSGSGKTDVSAGGVFLWMPKNTLTLPTVYIDNTSLTSVLDLNIGCISS